MAGIFSTIEHRVKSAALQATGLETISQLIQNNPNDIHMILNFLVVLAYPSNADQSTSQAKQKEKYLDQLENPTNAEMVINSIFRHLNTILSITVDTPLTSYASSIMDSVDAPTVLKSSTTSTRPRAMSGGAAPNDINNEKRVAILTGLCVVFELINNKNLNYVATYSSSLDTQNQTTINNIKELLSKSTETNVKANADKNSTLIENILNTINYDIGFIKSRVVDQSDIQAFKSISQFIDFVNVQKEAAQNILGPIQQAGDLRKLFTKMINTSSDNKNKDQVVKEYETSFNNVVDWLTNYISRDAQEIAEIIQGEKTVSGATGSKTGTKSGVNPAMMTMRGMEGMGMNPEMTGMNPEMMGMERMGEAEYPEMGALADSLMPHIMRRMGMGGMGMGMGGMGGMGMGGMGMRGMGMRGMGMGGMGMNPEMMRMMQMRGMYGGSKKTLKNNNKRTNGKKKKYGTMKNRKEKLNKED
jgi:hypothetical protein